jgi:distribution and morphology protein 34
MAFNFNWSPLTADEKFYERTRDLLTTALNKSPKPPIIVDDILVTEFNLGSVPPELEILEIGDIAEDRFRGIFKMCYSGDAFLTLKTRVQANPLNTYLCSKPDFTSPQPLAAASGLTIPLQITLSEIKLSAFIILVFSKQKGLTLVFRNDPLESLKVSSTFDSIQFVRDYLQRTIEQKLRDLMMDELPAIIHKLSLQLWCPDQLPKEDEPAKEDGEAEVDPLASPPLDAVDADGHVLDPSEIAALSLDGGPEVQSLFSQKNMLRLATLSNANRTLGLATPTIRDVMFRAWAGAMDKMDGGVSTPYSPPSLTRAHSFQGTSTTYTFSDAGSDGAMGTRPPLVSLGSATTGLTLGSGRHHKTGRKKKNRVVNLRKQAVASETMSEMGESASDSASTMQGPVSEPAMPSRMLEEQQEVQMPAMAPQGSKVRFRSPDEKAEATRPSYVRSPLYEPPSAPITLAEPVAPTSKQTQASQESARATADSKTPMVWEKRGDLESDTSSVILEQAWIMKMAGEIARRVYNEKRRNPGFWEDRDDMPPPAYEPRQ